MVNIGDVIEFKADGRTVIGQVVGAEGVLLEIKINHSNEFIMIENYFKEYLTGALKVCRHFSKEMIFFSKTIVVSVRISQGKPTRYERVKAAFKWQKWGLFGSNSNVWTLKARVQGTLFVDGFFIPFPYQVISSSLYFPQYNKYNTWKHFQKN